MRIESIATGNMMKAVVKEYDINGNKVKGYQLMIDVNDEAENIKCTQSVYDECVQKGMPMGTVCKFRLEYNTDPSVKKSGSLRITGIQAVSASASVQHNDNNGVLGSPDQVSTSKRKA